LNSRSAAPVHIEQHDAPSSLAFDSALLESWQNGEHARNQVNCRGCHREESDKSTWVDRPNHTVCKRCHASDVEGFLAGKHGMRTAQGLSPLSPTMARLPMKSNARNKVHGCNSCHSPHTRDRAREAVESCLDVTTTIILWRIRIHRIIDSGYRRWRGKRPRKAVFPALLVICPKN